MTHQRPHRRTRRRVQACILAGSIVSLLGAPCVHAASQTWDGGSLLDGLWSTVANWLGDPTPPGSTSVTTSTDLATFNAGIANTWGASAVNPIGIDANRNIAGINFDLAAGNYFIGATGGNALKLSNAGVIQILSTLTATNATMTINAPLQLQGASGTYTFRNNSANGTGAGAGTLNFGGAISGGAAGSTVLTLDGSNTNANTIGGAIGNGTATSVALTKTGIGSWTLTAANTNTGATTVNGGTLTLAFGTVSTNILASTSALTMGGGTLALTGTGTQTVAGLTTTGNTGSRIVLGANETLTLGALTSAGTNSALNFNTTTGGANGTTVGTGVIVLTGQTAGNVINSGFTVSDAGGFGLATVNGSNQVIRLTTTALLPATGATSATDYRIDNNAGGAAAAGSATLTVTASQAAKSITVDTTAGSGGLTLNSGVVLSNNTWNFGGVGSNTWQVTGSAGGAGIMAVASGNQINFNNYAAGAVTIAAPILANGNNNVRVFGTGTILFQGVNTYTGQTIVSGGTLQVPAGGSITHTGASLTVGNGSGDNGTLLISGGAVSSGQGSIGSSAGSSGSVTVSSGTWTLSTNIFVGNSGTGLLTISGGAFSATGVSLASNAGSSGSVTVSGGTLTNSSNLTVGSNGTGVLTISGGAMSNTSASIGSNAGSNGSVTVSGGTWTNSSNVTVGGLGTGVVNLTNVGVVTVGPTGSGTVTLGSASGSNGTLNVGTGGAAGRLYAGSVTRLSGTGVVNFNHTGGTGFASQLAGALSVNKLGAGTTVLTNASNSYTGATTVSVGTLLVSRSLSGSAVTVAAGAGFGYAAAADATLNLWSTLSLSGGAGTVLAGSIGATATSAALIVPGAATISDGAHAVNIYGISGVTPLAGTNTYTLVQGGAGSALNPATAPTLGTVYNNTNFTVGALARTATTLQVQVTRATEIGNAYWVGGLSGASNVWAASNGSTASNWATTPGGAVQALVPGTSANVTISASAPVTAPTSTVLGAAMSIAGLTVADTVNGLGLNADGFALTLGSGGLTMNAGVPASTIGADVVLGASQTWTNHSANALTVSGTVSGSHGLAKAGTGNLVLSGVNTYTGPTTISAGTITAGAGALASGGVLGNNSAVTLANAAGVTLNLAGYATQIGSLSGGGASGGDVTLGAATLTVGGDNTSPAAYDGVISGTGGALVKTGTGTLTLTNASTYSGATTINGGTVALGFGSVATNILPATTALTLGGATLSLSGTGIQTVNGLTVRANTVNGIVLGTNETLTLGALAAGASSMLNVNTVAGGANGATVGSGLVTLTGQTAGNVISYGYTVTDAGGFGLATVNASNQIIRLTTTTLLPATGATSVTDYRIDNNAGGVAAAGSSTLTVTASELAKSITVDTTVRSGVLTLNSAVALSNNTWVFGGTNPYRITNAAGAAAGTGLKAVASGDALVFNNLSSGAVTIAAPILANGSNTVSVFGTGTILFQGANTYTGQTTVSGGTLQVPAGGSITHPSANLVVGNASGDNGTLLISGGAVSNSAGTLGNSAAGSGSVTVSSGTWTNSGALIVGSFGTGALTISGGAVSNTSATVAFGARSSGSVTVSSGTWTNSSTLTVGNTGTGVLTISGGAVSNTSANIASSSVASGSVTVSGGTWTNSGTLTVGSSGPGVLNLTGSGVVQVGSTGTGTLTLASAAGSEGTLNLGTGGVAGTLNAGIVTGGSGNSKVVNFNHTGSTTFAPQLTGGLTVNKLGAGTTTLTHASNTYTGATAVSQGTLLVSGTISGSAIGVTGSGSTLGGTGTVKDVSVAGGAILQGGDGVTASGALTATGTVSLADNSVLKLTLGPGFTHSSLIRSGVNAWTFDSDQLVTFAIGDGATAGLYDNVISGLTGLDLNASNLATVSTWQIDPATGVTGTFSYDGTGGVDLTVTVIPEPGSAGLLLGGLALLGLRRRRCG